MDGLDPKAAPAVGAHWCGTGCDFRVWAPRSGRVSVVIEGTPPRNVPLQPEGGGYFSGNDRHARVGDRYRFKLDDAAPLPDPCSRYQPDGPHGPSAIVDPGAFQWTDSQWRGITLPGQVFYELHLGTFTPAGTFAAAIEKLSHLRDLGVTAIELMPVSECAGRWNWGYDGVCLFAPSHHYGPPDGLKEFVDAAHAQGLAVILDVVYNHLGPDGNYLASYSPAYFSPTHHTDWGAGLNFDGADSAPVREFFIGNACSWIRDFHLDGLRLDATQDILDSSPTHVLAELIQRARESAAPRGIVIVAEDESQQASRLQPVERGGIGLDAMWNDDFHHVARVAATGRRAAYYHDYGGSAQELLSALRHGFLYQGQYYPWQHQQRGQPMAARPMACVHYLQNHDQVANSVWGRRLHQSTSPGRCRALTALTLLGPQTPLLFMGQEFHSSRPFLFFSDHVEPLGGQVREGRGKFLSQFRGAATAEAQQHLADPNLEDTFRRCQLDWSEATSHAEALDLHRDLLRLRREDPVLRAQTPVDGAVLTPAALVLRWSTAAGERLLLVNLGAEVQPQPFAEPLLASGFGLQWQLLWSSEWVRYGGDGEENPLTDSGWWLPAESAVLFGGAPAAATVKAAPGKQAPR